MIGFQEFIHDRLEKGGFTTEDALASFVPLLRQVVAAHRNGQVAPLWGVGDLWMDGVRIWFAEAKLSPPVVQPARIRELESSLSRALEVVGETRLSAEADSGEGTFESMQIGKRGEPISRPVYLPGYVSWEHEIGHHDPLTDLFCLGLVLASLACGLDLNEPDDLGEFVRHRRNLFDLNPSLHPVLAKAIVRLTELNRHRRPQDAAALLHTLENYRDQDIDFDFDLARAPELRAAGPAGKREAILSRLQQRLFEISRRNRLLHFRQTMHTVNLTWASVPLSFDVQSIRPEQILTCDAGFQKALLAGKPISLNKHLRFEEAVYLPGLLDTIRSDARRDQAEFGFAQLRLVLCFLRWANLKEKPPERFDSPLVLVPVQLTKTRGVRDVYALEPLGTDAEINPVLRHYLKQLYAVELPERIDLASTDLDSLYDFLKAKVQASEPAVSIDKIDRPRIQLIHARARRRLDQYRRRVRLSGRGVRSFLDIDYSYDRDNFHPLGLRLFQTRIRPPQTQLRSIVEESPRPREFMTAPPETPDGEKERLLYSQIEEETNPYRWEFDLCNVTLGNFRYRKMSLVRDYQSLLESGSTHTGFDSIFSLTPRPTLANRLDPPPLEESYPIVTCDPTQSAAIGLARTGRDFVIQGPPGTGKSQTITNLIADYVVRGQRVLFVCEKRAAIDVVYHRLRQAGLHSLCCLIHDSQADKKEFILDLKQVYEGHLADPELPPHPTLSPAGGEGRVRGAAESERQKLLAAARQELTPLQHFDEAMRSTPDAAGVPLRRLLHRAIELRRHAPDLTPRELEQIPLYAQWNEHTERLGRLAGLLQEQLGERGELGELGDAILAKHPLRLLHSRLAAQDRPIEAVGQRLPHIEKSLEELDARVAELGLQAGEGESWQQLIDLVNYAARVQFLAEQRQLALLRTGSELAGRLDSLRQAHQTRSRELARAAEDTKHWRQKFPRELVSPALEQARRLERSFFRFFQPAWWRLRSALNRCYDFRGQPIRPRWSQLLERLQREYLAEDKVREVEERASEQFRFQGSFTDFQQRVAELASAAAKLPPHTEAFQRRLLADPSGDELIAQLAQLAGLKPLLDRLEAELAGVLEQYGSLSLDELRGELDAIDESLDDLPDFLPCLAELAALPEALSAALRRRPWPIERHEAACAGRSLAEVFRSNRALARHNGPARRRHLQRLEQAHDQLHAINAALVRERIRDRFLENVRVASLPHAQLSAEQKGFKARYNRGRRELEHEFGKTMRYKSIRDLTAGDTGLVLQDLKPVWLMSPLSVSDTLPLETSERSTNEEENAQAARFDVVIFDEASQVTLEESVPAVFRAAQVIVVGDEMQLPPTNFFSARRPDERDDATVGDGERLGDRLLVKDEEGEAAEYELGGDSLLDHAARSLPATMLGWHYRSRSESLISFSNAAFYHGRLLTVPEAARPAARLEEIVASRCEEGEANVARLLDRPVSFHLVQPGVYQQRRNEAEADYIAHLVRGLLVSGSGLSLGIVAFSEAQQGEIQDALERLAGADGEFRERLEAELEREQDDQFIGLLVKNLENIQGDERDVVILSVCYGPGPTGKMLMNFGPINQSGGERRLNVAFSRAKRHMAVVSSIRSPAITNDYNDGARCLKNYLRYAEAASAGNIAAAGRLLRELKRREERDEEVAAQAVAQDAVVAQLAAELRARGYQVDVSVGQSSFRCDLAVRREGDAAYRAGIQVDTDDYYRHADLLERDVLRPRLLRAFGWKVAQVLTKDWHEDPDAVLDMIERVLSGEAEPELVPVPVPVPVPDSSGDKNEDGNGGEPVAPAPETTVHSTQRLDEAQEAPAPGTGTGTGTGTAVGAGDVEEEDAEPAMPSGGERLPGPPVSEVSVASENTRYFEFIGGGSRKFWEITIEGSRHTVRFGRIGTQGQTKTKSFRTPADAQRDARRLVSEKLRKGYVERGPTP